MKRISRAIGWTAIIAAVALLSTPLLDRWLLPWAFEQPARATGQLRPDARLEKRPYRELEGAARFARTP
jgi:hypothetical protein